jgi:RNA polymerase sigma-70 factor (ECF subfamily)
MALLESVLAGLRRQYEDSGRGATFEALKGVLADGRLPASQAELARRLGTSEAAVQVAVHRLRRRYRDAIRAAIATTVAHDEIDDEIRLLFAALGP